MATSSATGSGSVVECQAQVEESENTLKLNLKKEEKKKKLKWTEDTVDNEGLGKKKSKCCCQYTKPKQDLDESSDESEDDCENCSGHTPSDKPAN